MNTRLVSQAEISSSQQGHGSQMLAAPGHVTGLQGHPHGLGQVVSRDVSPVSAKFELEGSQRLHQSQTGDQDGNRASVEPSRTSSVEGISSAEPVHPDVIPQHFPRHSVLPEVAADSGPSSGPLLLDLHKSNDHPLTSREMQTARSYVTGTKANVLPGNVQGKSSGHKRLGNLFKKAGLRFSGEKSLAQLDFDNEQANHARLSRAAGVHKHFIQFQRPSGPSSTDPEWEYHHTATYVAEKTAREAEMRAVLYYAKQCHAGYEDSGHNPDPYHIENKLESAQNVSIRQKALEAAAMALGHAHAKHHAARMRYMPGNDDIVEYNEHNAHTIMHKDQRDEFEKHQKLIADYHASEGITPPPRRRMTPSLPQSS